MMNVIEKTILTICSPELDLANREPEPVANVIRDLHTCLRTPAHYDAHEANLKRFSAQPNRLVTARSVVHCTVWKRTPLIFAIGVQVHRIISTPVFHSELLGVRRAPVNPNPVNRCGRA